MHVEIQVQLQDLVWISWSTSYRFNACWGYQAFQLHGYLYTLYFFSLFWGHVFFALQHNLGTFRRGELLKLVWISVAKILSRSLIMLFPQENRTFGISGINLCHLGAELSILRCRKCFRGQLSLKKKKIKINWALVFWLIWGHVAPLHDVMQLKGLDTGSTTGSEIAGYRHISIMCL
jgi:hypothetical protein